MYIIKKTKTGKFYFTINTKDGVQIAKSKTFLTLPGVKKEISTCQITAKSSKVTEEIRQWKH